MIRLMRTDDLSLHVFDGGTVPQYAILSHRWEDGEVTSRDLLDRSGQRKAGWQKVRRLCQFAESKGYRFVWVDTCCIDKSSSAELSEAINSMFKWYRKAEVCYAYLCDVPNLEDTMFAPWLERFKASEWFTRGWTLQELLAPHKLVFICSDWEEIGTRRSLSHEVSTITRIPEMPLVEGWSFKDQFGAPQFSIAQIMSWASTRRTTLIEDVAYSLMGLLRINMPLLYGEGPNAFIRLQLELMNKYDDNSLFAWRIPDSSQYLGTSRALNRSLDLHDAFWWGSLLAPTIRLFEGCHCHVLHFGNYEHGRSFSVTNRGILVEGLLRPYGKSRNGGSRWLLPMNCGRYGDWNKQLGLVLSGDGQFAMRVVNSQGFDLDLVDCDIESERSKKEAYEYRKVYIPQAWPGDFD